MITTLDYLTVRIGGKKSSTRHFMQNLYLGTRGIEILLTGRPRIILNIVTII